MTARDDLYLLACSDMPVTSDEVNEAIDAFAHELAEQVRAQRGTTTLESGHHFFNGMDFAADLIDPKAQRATTEGGNT